jgi:D-ornithine 4,5-aminomutase subunit beta
VAQYDPNAVDNPSQLIDGCTLEKPEKIIFIDELDENDNVNTRMAESEKYRGDHGDSPFVKPEVQWLGDGVVQVEILLPIGLRAAQFAAIEFGKKMNLKDVEVIHIEAMHPSEGTRVQLKGVLDFDLDMRNVVIPPEPVVMSDDEIREEFDKYPVKIVAATVGEDEHSVGLREIIDIKHGGIEKYGCEVEYLGTSVPIEKLVDAAIELNANVILASTIISHDDVHYKNMKRIHEYAIEKGVRDKFVICAGGTQVTPEVARQNGMDEGFGRYDRGVNVATYIVNRRRELRGE